jgi:16S rRNA (cytosine1402-N4)-methyltransferase
MNDHTSVLLAESLEALSIKPDGVYIDGTFGRGGHTSEILNCLGKEGRLIAIDRDNDAVTFAKKRFGGDKRFSIFHCPFSEMEAVAKEAGVYGKVNGIFLDLGVSSPQLDEDERGFSFLRDGPLDMRMDNTKGLSAMDWINRAPTEEISQVLKEYGEERFSKRIARAITESRNENAITTTKQFADIVSKANPAWEKHKHPATRVFQAVRIFINRELDELELALASSMNILGVEGRLVIISFHSLEDRIVKRFINRQAKGEAMPRKLPIRQADVKLKMRIISKAIKPGRDELNQNPRARSAVLRVGEKLL